MIGTVTLAERPELAAAVPELLASRWPAFMLEGRPGHDADMAMLLAAYAPQHQVLLMEDDAVLGAGLSLPIAWDGTVADLPAGWDGVVTAAADLAAGGAAPTAVSALSVTLAPAAAGRGLAVPVIRAMKQAAAGIGAGGMLVPVRPVHKARYPLIHLGRYVGWRTPAGDVFDPWLRLHMGLGAEVLDIAERSLTVHGSVAEWERWTGLALPDSGTYVIPGGLVPLEVDHDADRATYAEPNVWMLYREGDGTSSARAEDGR